MNTWEELEKPTSALQKSVNELYQTHNALQTLHNAQAWDKDARALINLLHILRTDWAFYRKHLVNKLAQLKEERRKKSFFSRALSSRSGEAEATKLIKQVDIETASLTRIVEELNGMLEKTPTNKTEQAEIASAIREVKKDLILQKREVNETMCLAKTNARQKTANWTRLNKGLLGSVARYQRISIEIEKERALAPTEGIKMLIEKQLTALEKDLNWVLHLKELGQSATKPKEV
jgi:hypothetical protein